MEIENIFFTYVELFPLVTSLAKSKNKYTLSFTSTAVYYTVPNEKSKSCCFISDVDKLEESGGG